MTYAYSLTVWLTFLSSLGCSWDDAAPAEQEAFKVWRETDTRNTRLVTVGTYEHDLIAVRLFYLWAAAEYGVASPIRMRRGRGRRRDGSPTERPATEPVAVRDRDVKRFDPNGYARYRVQHTPAGHASLPRFVLLQRGVAADWRSGRHLATMPSWLAWATAMGWTSGRVVQGSGDLVCACWMSP